MNLELKIKNVGIALRYLLYKNIAEGHIHS